MAVRCANSAVAKAISTIEETAWEPIAYTPDGIAQVAEADYGGRLLIVRRTRLADAAQQALFPGWRHNGFVTDLPPAVDVDRSHREHEHPGIAGCRLGLSFRRPGVPPPLP